MCSVKVRSDFDDPTKPLFDFCVDEENLATKAAETFTEIEHRLQAAIFSTLGMISMMLANFIYQSKYNRDIWLFWLVLVRIFSHW